MDKYPSDKSISINVFRFDPHPRRKQLAIIGEVVFSTGRNAINKYSEPFKKVVQLVSLTHSSRVNSIVNDILQACPYVKDTNANRSSLHETIKEIANREYDSNGLALTSRRASDGSYLPRYLDILDEVDSSSSSTTFLQPKVEEADINQLNHYVELLYEEESKKIEGLRLISILSKTNRYLLLIYQHASALNAIIRTLREDRKRNLDSLRYIFSICLDFAKFAHFHRILIRHKLHHLILDKIDPELERYEKWKLHLQEKESLTHTEPSRRALEDFITANESFEKRASQQNKVLQLGFSILHYLSEDRMVAKSLLHQGVVTSLTDALDHVDCFPLWETVVGFLKDMSLFKEYVEQIIYVNTLEKVAKILKAKGAIPLKLARAFLGLLCNLSFNSKLRYDMIQLGLLSVFSKCLAKSSLSETVAKTLYVMSQDACLREKIAKPEVCETILNQLTHQGNEDNFENVSKIKGALAVNLGRDPNGAWVMGEYFKIQTLAKNAIKNHDILGMKVIRNIVESHPSALIDQQAGHLAKAVVEVNSLDFVLECVGTLAHVSVDRVDFPDVVKKNRLIIWLKRQLLNYINMTNMFEISYQLKTAALEVVILLSNICKKEEGARFIVGEGFIDQILTRLISEEHTDPQIVQQIVYVFNVCCSHPSVAAFLVTKTQFPQELMTFALRIGGKLRGQCELTLHKLSKYCDAWLETMMEHEFLIYNETWTTVATNEFAKDEKEATQISSILGRKPYTLSDYQILQDLKKGSLNPYKNIMIDDDDDDMPRPESNGDYTIFDDSITDDESIFLSLSHDNSTGSTGRNLHDDSASKLYERYWKEFGEEMAQSREWRYFQ